ncbi:ABC transporter permease [Cupriavidus basilensis]
MPATFSLGALALFVALSVALPVGVLSAVRRDTAADYVARSFSILMLAVPSFWLGTMVMVFPSVWWGWSPEVRYVPFLEDPLQHISNMLVPAIILGMALSAITMRMTRTMMLEVLRQDYIRTAWAKGLNERHGDPAPRAAQRADPGGDAHRPAGAAADRRRGGDRADFRAAGHGIAVAGCRQPAGLSRHHRRVPGGRRGGHAHQPARGPELRAVRPESEASLMARPIANAPAIQAAQPPREMSGTGWAVAALALVKRLFREKPLGAAGAVDLPDLPVLRRLRRRGWRHMASTRSA